MLVNLSVTVCKANFQLRKSVLEDRMTYPDDNFPPEKRAEIITGKVQDAILKKEAAMVVHDAYLKIINIMRKARQFLAI